MWEGICIVFDVVVKSVGCMVIALAVIGLVGYLGFKD